MPVYFNPRTPRGVRQKPRKRSISSRIFQSTHPSRGATASYIPAAALCTFQSTHPSRGATCHPYHLFINSLISIHAPLAGCDILQPVGFPDTLFQSTHPSRGATLPRVPNLHIQRISIHAPLAGCDLKTCKALCVVLFQSTHPSRGATQCTCRKFRS